MILNINIPTLIIGLLLSLAVIGAIIYLIKHKNMIGCGYCDHNCENCEKIKRIKNCLKK